MAHNEDPLFDSHVPLRSGLTYIELTIATRNLPVPRDASLVSEHTTVKPANAIFALIISKPRGRPEYEV